MHGKLCLVYELKYGEGEIGSSMISATLPSF